MDKARGRIDPATLALLDPEGTFSARLAMDRRELARLERDLWALPVRDRETRLAALAALAHRLAGAAGTFGYARVGDRALELEACILASSASKLHDRRATVQESLARLAAALTVAGGGNGQGLPRL